MGLLEKIEKGTYRRNLISMQSNYLIENKPFPKLRMIESDIDMLYKGVNSAGEISVENLAKITDLDSAKAEELARILAKKGLIAMRYPLFGKAIVSAKDYKSKSEKQAVRKSDENRNLIIFGIAVSLVAIIAITALRYFK